MEIPQQSESEVKQRYQTTIPKSVREAAALDVGDQLLWEYDQIKDEMIVIRKPKSFSDALWGLGKEVWEQEGGDAYIERGRDEWK